MASTGKDGITHYSWQDIHSQLRNGKLGPRTKEHSVIIEAGKRSPDAPCGTLEVTVVTRIELREKNMYTSGKHTVRVVLRKRVFVADAIFEATQAADRAAANAWIDKYGADWWVGL